MSDIADREPPFTIKGVLSRLPGGKARDALHRAAMQEMGSAYTPHGFIDDLDELVACDPRVHYEKGDRPSGVATVVVDLVHNREVYLCTKNRAGLGLYVKLYKDEHGGHLPAIATDPACGPARTQTYEAFD